MGYSLLFLLVILFYRYGGIRNDDAVVVYIAGDATIVYFALYIQGADNHRRGVTTLCVDRRGVTTLGVDRRGATTRGIDRRGAITLGVDRPLGYQKKTYSLLYFYILVDPYLVLCKLLAVRHQHVGKVLILDTPFEIVFNNGNNIFYALSLV